MTIGTRLGVQLGATLGASLGSSAMSVLVSAPGSVAFFDAGYEPSITKDGSNLVSSFVSRIGSHTVTASGAQQPTWSATSPTGRRGFTVAGGNRMVSSTNSLATTLDGSQAYSALWVAKANAAANRAAWSIGNTSVANEFVWEGTISTGFTRSTRAVSAGNTGHTGSQVPGTGLRLYTSVYSGSAYSCWLDGTQSVNAAANTRAPTCDTFTLFSLNSGGAFSLPWAGEFYALIISTSAWSSGDRTRLEAAAKTYWGTP